MKAKHAIPAVGEVFIVPYPFVQDTWTDHYTDSDSGLAFDEIPTWKPGTVNVSNSGEEEYGSSADGMGSQILTVVGVYKPGRYPTRVFYSRQWRDPDGKTFGKTKCRCTTVATFGVLVRGYRHPFKVSDHLRQASA